MTNKKRLIVLSSPSGGGKSVVSRHVLQTFENTRFSVSATTRSPRPKEENGKAYYFLSKDEFIQKINDNKLAEYEEIFGNYYGTLKSEISNAFESGEKLLFDVDVKGALSLRDAYPDDALLIFLEPPDIETLEKRLRMRGTENDEQIARRLSRSQMEINRKHEFDFVVVNLVLEDTFAEIDKIISENT